MVKHLRMIALVLGAALVLAACGGSDEGEAGGGGDEGGGESEGETVAAETCEDADLSSPPDEPVTMRIGHGRAAEEPFWLMTAAPDNTQYQGEWYEMELLPFRGTEERLQAYQAGELDAVAISPQAQIRGQATGALELYAIGTVMREAEPDAFSTSFVALEDSGITSMEDLSGASIAVVDIGSQLDFLARAGVRQGGGDSDSDADYIVFPFPAQEEALRGGQIDVAGLPEPFYTLAMNSGGVVDVFDAADITDFAYDLLTISFDRGFVESNLGAVCAWAADYEASMEYYRENTEEARSQLVGSQFVELPEEVYLETGDYARPEGGVVDTEGMQQMLDQMIEFDILTEEDRVDPEELVLPGVSLGH